MPDSWTKIVNRTAEQLAIKVGGLKKSLADRPGMGLSDSNQAERQNFFQTSNFESWRPCCTLTYRDPKYLFRKI